MCSGFCAAAAAGRCSGTVNMTETGFCIKLAGIPIGVRALHSETEQLCRDYLCQEEPLFWVISAPDLIDRERFQVEKQFPERKQWEYQGREAYLETLAVYRQIAEKIVDYQVLLVHGSAVSVDGYGFLFMADSGTGKSTHARLWREVLPAYGHKVEMINDDKPLLRFEENRIFLCGTPWDGKHHLNSNTMTPVQAICFLVQGEENRIIGIREEEAFPSLLKHSYRSKQEQRVKQALVLLDRLCKTVPCYVLACNMEPEAALVSYEGMND